jgi:acylphosphatase
VTPVASAHVRVTGHVQGVGFRWGLERRARSLGLAGWVRNEPDGSVAAEVEGPRERVESLVDWCRRGPAGADVRGVELDWQAPRGHAGFSVR